MTAGAEPAEKATPPGPRLGADRWPWVVRLAWIPLPFTAGPALAEGLGEVSAAVATTASALLWLGWAAGVLASFVPHPLSLTTLRLLAPAAVAASVASALAGAGAWPLAVAWSAITGAAVLSPTWSEWCVNGPAYPNERRLLLRVPAPLLAGPLVLAWALAVAGLVTAPLLGAAGAWPGAAAAAVLGWPLAWLLLRALHQLSLRWLVFVPAGVVIHDPMTLDAPVLLARPRILGLGPAPVGSDAQDLTQRAAGLILELTLSSELELVLVRPGRREASTVTVTAVLVAPSRPGRVLSEAASRRITLG